MINASSGIFTPCRASSAFRAASKRAAGASSKVVTWGISLQERLMLEAIVLRSFDIGSALTLAVDWQRRQPRSLGDLDRFSSALGGGNHILASDPAVGPRSRDTCEVDTEILSELADQRQRPHRAQSSLDSARVPLVRQFLGLRR